MRLTRKEVETIETALRSADAPGNDMRTRAFAYNALKVIEEKKRG